MSQILLLLIVAFWLLPSEDLGIVNLPPAAGISLFLAFYLLMVMAMVVWGARLAKNPNAPTLPDRERRFLRWLLCVRIAIPLWLLVGLFGGLGWRTFILRLTGSVGVPDPDFSHPLLHAPGFLLGTLPALAAWVGLWWAQYPTERIARERALLDHIDQALPIHAPPTLKRFLLANLRQQLLFILAPVSILVVLHDIIAGALRLGHVDITPLRDFEDAFMLPAVGLVYLFIPALMRRILNARPLPDSSLRRRLTTICERSGLRYREILLWHTDFSMGNAAVIGLLPRVRYILLSDLLLERMTDVQIEAVFAHEVGHIVHKHILWFGVFFIVLMLAFIGPMQTALGMTGLLDSKFAPVVCSLLMLGGWFYLFGILSRSLERQADVYAARMMQTEWGTRDNDLSGPIPATSPLLVGVAGFPAVSLPAPAPAGDLSAILLAATIIPQSAAPPRPEAIKYSLAPWQSFVGEYGAAIFASALERVAAINHIPVKARDWRHPSIDVRKRELLVMSADPTLTTRFDHLMKRTYRVLVACLIVCGAWAALELYREQRPAADKAPPARVDIPSPRR